MTVDARGETTFKEDPQGKHQYLIANEVQRAVCLLYTSDAADERSSVDLGGRRIIKKKKNTK